MQTCVQSDLNSNQTKSSNKTVERIHPIDAQDNSCLINGKKYSIGSKLDIGQRCVHCTCRIPPEFTCIQRSCPPTPPDNACKVTYSPSECCPTFDCNYNKTADQTFDPSSCPTPMCATGCQFETYPDRCPTCVCKPSFDAKEMLEYDVSDV
ncbi:unnamed protein product [Oppiella nova]|uniref:VWFC domain-containing protein n=1 Tax=Oppiella nova TaxID=334625 RepID=A0A7R9QUX0_9ACAR|nr:unnamed protein product [Oppiella nova]CAG2175929.1 unnamed protein product [Oppiella nova]